MKKQFLIIAVVSSAILFSCSKEKIETPPTETLGNTAGKTSVTPDLVINTLNIDLVGEFEFDGNLKDATGKLEDAYPTLSRAPVMYTYDRKGQTKKAIYFNGKYGADVFGIPSTPGGASFSVWIKVDTIPTTSWISILNAWHAFSVQQYLNTFYGSFWNSASNPLGQGVSTSPLNSIKWHHIVGTHDNTSMKLYVDGALVGTSPTPAGSGPYYTLDNYNVGYWGGSYWKGSMDDLRFYKRVLSAAEVSQLYNL